MWNWLLGKRKQETGNEALRGAPERVRVKTYSAENGYVYLHCYRGYRAIESGTEHVFQVSRQGGAEEMVGIAVPDSVLEVMSKEAGRAISPTERYALAKLRLFALLDGAEAGAVPTGAVVDEEQARVYWETLDL